MSIKCELVKCECYKEKGCWFMHLEFIYQTKQEECMTIMPKVELPFDATDPQYTQKYSGYLNPYYLKNSNEMRMHSAPVINPTTGEELGEHKVVTFHVKSFIHKMTKKDIEEALGYNIEIINEEDK